MKTRIRTTVAGLCLCFIGAGCDSASDPCSEADCAGAADLMVASVSVTSASRDPLTGLGVVQPDAIDVRIVVRNTSDTRSGEKPVLIELGASPALLVTVPALAGGASFEHNARIDGPPAGTFLIDSDTMRVTATVVTLDRNRDNNAASSEPFHLALPALRVTTTVDSLVLRANAGMPSSITIENVSRYATMQPATFAYCIFDLGGRCTQTFRAKAFGKTVLPSVGPAQSMKIDYPVNVPSSAANQNRVESYVLGTCMAPGDVDQSLLPKSGMCWNVRQVQVRPDYEACDPTMLEPGKLVEGSLVCRNPCEIYVFAVNVERGHTYRAIGSNGVEDRTLRWRTRYRDNPVDASPASGFQPAVAGTYYLVTEPKFCGALGSQSVELSVTDF